MNILFYVSFYPDENGCQDGVFFHNQAKALKKNGYNVKVMHLDFRSIRKRRKLFYYYYNYDGIEIYRVALPIGPIYPIMKLLSNYIDSYIYKQIEKTKWKPDIILCHNALSVFGITSLARKYRVPYIVMEHSSLVLTENLSIFMKKRIKRIYADADSLIAVSTSLKKRMQKYTNSYINVIPNMLPDYMFNYDPNNKCKAENTSFVFVSIGRLIESKGFDNLIRAFSEVVSWSKNVELKIIGDGKEKGRLLNIINDLHISDYVEMMGEIKNDIIPSVISSYDCFVLPSRFETFGVVFIEAMACGLPVIATRCGGPEDYIDSRNGLLVSIDDVNGLRNAMIEMIQNRNEYASSNELRNTIYNCYSENSFIKRMSIVFNNCIKYSSEGKNI